VIAGHFTVMTEKTARLLKDYVRQGGQLVFGCRTGYKDSRGHCRMAAVPGPVAELCGVVVDDFTMVSPLDEAPRLTGPLFGDAGGPHALAFNEILTPSRGVEVLASYGGGYYAAKPALTRHPHGSGAAYYYGAVFNVEVAESLIAHLRLSPAASEWLTVPEDIEYVVREHASTGQRLHFLLNYTQTDQRIHIKTVARDLLSGRDMSGSVVMQPYGVLVLPTG
jgi:beta-galactosidase